MAPVVKFVVAALLVLVVVTTGPSPVFSSATPVDDAAGAPTAAAPAPLVARLHLAFSAMAGDDAVQGPQQGQGGGGGWMMECFGAVTELRSCTNEIVLFFLNGESWLGHDCCLAIRTVTRHCWPSMLASVGFTAEEADVLRGFCDAEVGGAQTTPPPPPAPLALAPAPAAHP